MEVLTLPAAWRVRLRTGDDLEVWAASWSKRDGFHVFDTLVRATSAEQEGLDISGSTPADPQRVLVVVARIPETAVLEVLSRD